MNRSLVAGAILAAITMPAATGAQEQGTPPRKQLQEKLHERRQEHQERRQDRREQWRKHREGRRDRWQEHREKRHDHRRDLRHRDLRHRDLRHRDLRHRDLRHRDLRHRDLPRRDPRREKRQELSEARRVRMRRFLEQHPGLARRIFAAADKDKNGVLDPSERKHALALLKHHHHKLAKQRKKDRKDHRKEHRKEERKERLHDRLDRNGDGKVGPREHRIRRAHKPRQAKKAARPAR